MLSELLKKRTTISMIFVFFAFVFTFFALNSSFLSEFSEADEKSFALVLFLVGFVFSFFQLASHSLLHASLHSLVIYSLLCLCFSSFANQLPVSATYMLFSVLYFLTGYFEKTELKNQILLDLGLFFGIAVFTFLPSLLMLVWFILVIISYGNEVFNRLLAFFLGFFTFFILLIGVLFLSNKLNTNLISADYLKLNPIKYSPLLWFYVPIVFTTLAGVYDHYTHQFIQSVKKRSYYGFNLLYLVLWLTVCALFISNTYGFFFVILLPLTVINSKYFQYLKKSKWKEFIYWVIFLSLIGCLAYQYNPH